ncbi:hypothetical protein [Polaromonas aquatica]|uniref:hypothetical protein n=1 Tax=Polaromonas aquatica TaxID=332657 RepID=UPI003D65F6F2
MKTIKFVFAAALVAQSLLGIHGAAQAQTSGSFGVTIMLRSFSEAVTADHRCTHRGQPDGSQATLRISCPATVDIQAIAAASTSRTGQTQRMNAMTDSDAGSRLAVVAGKPMNSRDPVELTISW